MKRLILALTVAFLFVSGSAFAATINCIMYSSENDGSGTQGEMAGYATPPITSDYTFTIETDGAGNITAFTNLFSNYFYAYSAGGYDPRDGGPFSAGEQIYPNGIKQDASTLFDNNPEGTTLWFKCQANPTSPFEGLVFNLGLLEITYASTTDLGVASFGANPNLAEDYIFHAVPIPAAGWLLMSGLVGIVGFRKKFMKET